MMQPEILGPYDLTDEIWREYQFPSITGESVTYRIDNPQALYLRKNGHTHRVVDSEGVVHIFPGPGFRGCALRFKPKDSENPMPY
jgi:streptogramin lyase